MKGVFAFLVIVGYALVALAVALVVIWTIHHVRVVEPYRDPDSRAVTRVWPAGPVHWDMP